MRGLLAGAAVMGLAGCFASQLSTTPLSGNAIPGFWRGFWHGIIAPIAFVVSIFSEHVRVYAIPNTGRWYDFGFMIGIGGFTHGVWRSNSARRKRLPADQSVTNP